MILVGIVLTDFQPRFCSLKHFKIGKNRQFKIENVPSSKKVERFDQIRVEYQVLYVMLCTMKLKYQHVLNRFGETIIFLKCLLKVY